MITNLLLMFLIGLSCYKLGYYFSKLERADFIHDIFTARFRREKEAIGEELTILKHELREYVHTNYPPHNKE